ncbi:MAG: DegQ family serine endoprotease [Pyrinomonadaceae bacterium]
MENTAENFRTYFNFKTLFIAAMAISLIGGAVLFGLIYKINAQSVAQLGTSDNTVERLNVPAGNPRNASTSYADIVEKASPAVVTIRADIVNKSDPGRMSPFQNDPLFRRFFGEGMPQQQQQPRTEHALGSGVIVRADGTILTNNHVVAGAEKVVVELNNRKSFDAKIVGTDPLSDLAVLKIDGKELPTLALGDSDKVRVGDVVLAIGNPLGLRQTVTSGIISAKGRATGLSDGSFEDFLQTDAPINQGNSGGALVDLNGNLIGINSQILSPSGGNIGIGFAIPSNMAKTVMEQLVKDGKVHRGMIGIGIQNLDSQLAAGFGLSNAEGVLVNSVAAGSPGEKAGIKQGDVITAVDGKAVSDSNDLRNRIAETSPGTSVSLTIFRDGKEQTLSAVLDEFKQPSADGPERDSSDSKKKDGAVLGLALQVITPEIADHVGVDANTKGLVVTEVESGSRAEDAGLQQGDVILQANRQPVATIAEMQSAISGSNGKPVLLLVSRQGRTLYLTV